MSPGGGGGGTTTPRFDSPGADTDLRLAFDQFCVAMEFFLEFNGATAGDGAAGVGGDMAAQLAADAAAFHD